jgi:hypothetical protein
MAERPSVTAKQSRKHYSHRAPQLSRPLQGKRLPLLPWRLTMLLNIRMIFGRGENAHCWTIIMPIAVAPVNGKLIGTDFCISAG